MKRVLSFCLVLVLVIGCFAGTTISASAASAKSVKAPQIIFQHLYDTYYNVPSGKMYIRPHISLRNNTGTSYVYYELYQSINDGSWKKIQTIKNSTKTGYYFDQTYKVDEDVKKIELRVRPYVLDGSKKVYGSYSTIVTVKLEWYRPYWIFSKWHLNFQASDRNGWHNSRYAIATNV